MDKNIFEHFSKHKKFLFLFLIFSLLLIMTSCRKDLVEETSVVEIVQENDAQEQPAQVETNEIVLPEFDQIIFERDLAISDEVQRIIVMAYLNILQDKDKFFYYIYFDNGDFRNYNEKEKYKGEYKTISEYLKKMRIIIQI